MQSGVRVVGSKAAPAWYQSRDVRAARGAFAAAIFTSVVLAAFGKEASLVPGTGQLTKKFTDDYDATVRQVISATVGTGPFNITILAKPPSDEEDSKKDE